MKATSIHRTRAFATILGALLAIAAASGEAGAAVTAVPSPGSVSGAQAVTIVYQFSGIRSITGGLFNGDLESLTGGTFILPTAGAPVLGTGGAPLVVTITNGSGQVQETLSVPASVVDNTIRSGVSGFLFRRLFAAPVGNVGGVTAQVSILVRGSEAAGPLAIKRIELYFGNRRGEITVERNRRGLKAFADIRFVGSGLLSGFWEVDGRRLLDVNQTLNFGTSVTLSTPDSPDLPTFDPGIHIVRFVITNPSVPIGLPQVLYYVTPAEEKARTIRLTVPEGREGAAAPTRTFRWDKPPGIDLFLVEFSEEPGGKPLFSAFVRDSRYTLPPAGLEGVFTPGRTYYWRVKGFDARENLMAESPPTGFVF